MYTKDPNTGFIQNHNEYELKLFEVSRDRVKREKKLQQELADVRSEMVEIRNLLKNIQKETK